MCQRQHSFGFATSSRFLGRRVACTNATEAPRSRFENHRVNRIHTAAEPTSGGQVEGFLRQVPIDVAPLPTVRQNGLMPSASIHGHVLLNYLIDLGKPVKIEALRKWAREAHGQQARYHTCSVQDLTLDGILGFLQERNKVTLQNGSISAAVTHVCSHDDDPTHLTDNGHH
jgi:probable metal-binding protein